MLAEPAAVQELIDSLPANIDVKGVMVRGAREQLGWHQ